VLASRCFRNAPSLSRLLAHIVERTLDGKAEDLKEYSLGVDVFDRGEQFDAKLDTIVRVQARRLRQKLEEYYQSEGSGDPIVIALAKGRYVPEFNAARTNTATDDAVRSAPASWMTRPRRSIAAVLFASIAAIGVLLAAGVRDRISGSPTGANIRSVAVLPLVNLSRDPGEEPFATGITEALITDLGKVDSLRVISHTSVNHYKDTSLAVPEIAKQLQVDAVVEGTVTRAGDRIRVTANLIQASPEKHLWAESYERGSRDVLDIQAEIAGAIAREVRGKFAASGSTRAASANFEAYQEFIAGQYLFERFALNSINKSFEHFDRAIALDRNFARAYATKAQAYIPLVSWGAIPPRESLATVESIARTALSLDERSAEAHTALGGVHVMRSQWADAEREFSRAIALSPNNYRARDWHGYLLEAIDDREGAIAEQRVACEIDPLSESAHKSLGSAYFYAGRYDEAIAEELKAIDLDPNFPVAHRILGRIYEERHDYVRAISEFQRSGSISHLAHAYAVSGHQADARSLLADLDDRSRHSYVSHATRAVVFIGLGERNSAVKELEAAETDGEPLDHLNVDSRFEPLRTEPKFLALLRRLGFGKSN